VPRVFSYGSLQRAEVQRAMFGRTLDARADQLRGFERTLSGNGKHANLVPRGDVVATVSGILLELTDAELVQADEYERNDGYARIEVTLVSGAAAWLYIESPH
jgi:gamma-glutamylcyclotransferase (GGCT)/AIG2-like uncharacterized protein YtfP